MEPDRNKFDPDEILDQMVGAIPEQTTDEDSYGTRSCKDQLVASEVMNLVFEVTRTSAEIYELVADLAWSWEEQPRPCASVRNITLQKHRSLLGGIAAATEESERRIRVLESQVVTSEPELFNGFLEDSTTSVAIFKNVVGQLSGIIYSNDNASPEVTGSVTLVKIMESLEICSDNVAGLPGKGISVFYQFLVEFVFDLQNRTASKARKSIRFS